MSKRMELIEELKVQIELVDKLISWHGNLKANIYATDIKKLAVNRIEEIEKELQGIMEEAEND